MKSYSLIAGALLIGILSFALGRYTGRTTITTTDKKTDEVRNVDTHQNEIITEVKKPDGTVTTITTINTNIESTDKKDTDTMSKTVVKTASAKTNISALIGTSTHDFFGPPSYGISVNREVIGPITVGAFGLMNGTFGLSVGITF